MADTATISWIGYGWETSYGTTATTVDKAFGHQVRLTNLNRKNNIEKGYSMGSRVAQFLQEKGYEGMASVEFTLANPWFLQGVLGAVADTGSAADYTHTFTEADTIPSLTIVNNVQTDTASVSKLLGAKINTCTITAAVNELIKVKLDMPYANETHSTSTTSKLSESFDLFTFAQGTLELPDGSTLAKVQNAELVMTNNTEMIMGIGSRFAQEQVAKSLDHSASVTQAYQASADLLQKLYGSSYGPADSITETADLVLTFTNGETGTSERAIIATLTGIKLDEENLPQDPTDKIFEDVALHGRTMTIVANNSTQTAA